VIIGVDMVTTGRGDLILIPLRLGLVTLLFVSADEGLLVVFVVFVADLRFAVCRKFCTPCSYSSRTFNR